MVEKTKKKAEQMHIDSTERAQVLCGNLFPLIIDILSTCFFCLHHSTHTTVSTYNWNSDQVASIAMLLTLSSIITLGNTRRENG